MGKKRFTLADLKASPNDLIPASYKGTTVWVVPQELWSNPASASFFFSKHPTAPVYGAKPHVLGFERVETKADLKKKKYISDRPTWDESSENTLISLEQWDNDRVDENFINNSTYVDFKDSEGKWKHAFCVRQGTTSFPVSFSLVPGCPIYKTRPSRIRDAKDPSGNIIIRKVIKR